MSEPWQGISACVREENVAQFVDKIRQHIQSHQGSALRSLSVDLQRNCFSEVRVHCMQSLLGWRTKLLRTDSRQALSSRTYRDHLSEVYLCGKFRIEHPMHAGVP